MGDQPEPFDRRHDLKTLLAGVPTARLGAALSALLGERFRLCDEHGAQLAGAAGEGDPDGTNVPLRHQLETVGTLAAPGAAPAHLRGAAALLELVIDAVARLRMASDLHLQAVHEDYKALLEKHAALLASEARYKALAAQLEERIQAQVATVEAAQRQLYQAEKMASVGQLAAGVAHEINNPIGFIRSNLGTAAGYVARLARLAPLVRQAPGPLREAWAKADLDYVLEDFAELIGESSDGAGRVAKIVSDLKAFSSIDSAEEEPSDLNENLRAVANVAQPQLAGRAALLLDLAPLPRLRCHPGRLNQVFLSLVQNAAQAVGAGGEIRITSAAAPGEIRIAVRDNGRGIPPEVLPRIFDPFFTTHEVGKGTGLGLTVARDIVAAHGGRIEAHSTPGRGTTVTVTLPVQR